MGRVENQCCCKDSTFLVVVVVALAATRMENDFYDSFHSRQSWLPPRLLRLSPIMNAWSPIDPILDVVESHSVVVSHNTCCVAMSCYKTLVEYRPNLEVIVPLW